MRWLFATVIFLCVLFCMQGCTEKYETVFTKTVTAGNSRFVEDSIITDSSTGKHFSRLYRPATHGMDVVYHVPPEHQDKELWVVFEGRSRSNFAHSNASITLITSNDSKAILCWKASGLRYYYTDINKWCHFKDSIFLPHNFNNTAYDVVNAFAFLGNSTGENFDIDTFTVSIRKRI